MNGTRVIWIIGAAAVAAAVVLALSGGPASPQPAEAVRDTVAASPAAPAAIAPSVAAPAAVPTPAAPAPVASAGSPAAPLPSQATDSRAARPPAERSPGALDIGLDRTIREAKVVPGNIVRKRDEGTGEELLYADGKYEIRGAGTEESPFRVSWECLASASETYMPRLNEREIPQRIALLDGKVVEVEGYLAFPLMVSETKELLVMLNQWDGCCIGVPPTPYDAIEVKLVEPAKRGGRHATFNFGGIRGTLKVDPYLVENWLVGLYVLENARTIEGARPEL